ncbi:cysteine-rich and transmembrane domain-containing protein 1 [Hippoglossus stenolepis]|uniref:cysteine-rich and transmembrane domain-containing protein 1 n=1 Tax=Hippoglossus stenolepis TaxID=195615 RepID=UPI00159C2DAA|nr:cysteine-rich and transmembrane domain-containing protein 1 [Hippoglossus stenolepis]
MDPSKSPTAPAMNYGGEKSSMGQMPPPAYLASPYPGYPPQPGMGYPPQPGMAYPPQPQGFGSPPPYGNEAYGHQPHSMRQEYPAHPATVTVHQPMVYVTRSPLAEPASDYMCYSVFTLMCCCLPLGIAALIYSISTREANHAGDQLAAERSSRLARTLNHVGLGIGLLFSIVMVVYIVVVATVISQ